MLRFRALTLSLAIGAAATSWSSAAAASWDVVDGTLAAPTAVTATISGTTATVSWTPASEPVPVSYVVGPLDTAVGALATRSCTGCTSLSFSGLRPGAQYQFNVAAYSAAGRSAAVGSPVVTATDPLCATAEPVGHVCLGVDAASNLGTEVHPGSGFLHGVTRDTSAAAIKLIAPTSWRESVLSAEANAAIATGATVTLSLSDGWWTSTYEATRGAAESPWSDWAAYTAYVQQAVQIMDHYGVTNVYWDIQNEPETSPYYDPAAPATTALVLQQYLTAYNAIKAVDPSARIVGPSIDWAFSDATFPVDMKHFLDYAAATGMRFDAIAWHENGDGGPEGRPEAVVDHAATVRSYLARYPQLGNPQLFVNEYGGAAAGLVPGWLASYLAAFDKAGVTEADHSCFTDCWTNPGTLDGALLLNGLPTSAGLVYERYAAMTGTRLSWVSGSDRTNAVAVKDAVGVTHLMISRDDACPSWLVKGCWSSSAIPASQVVDLKLSGLPNGWVSVHTELVGAVTGALSQTVDLGTKVVGVSSGRASLSLPPLPDDAVLLTTVSPVASTIGRAAAPRRSLVAGVMHPRSPVGPIRLPVTKPRSRHRA